jgi:hypothetical protein
MGFQAMLKAVGDASIVAAIRAFQKINKPGQMRSNSG